MKCQILFARKNNKNKIKMSSAEIFNIQYLIFKYGLATRTNILLGLEV